MNKAYVLGPVAALLVFVAAFTVFHRGHADREAARQNEIRVAHEAKLAAEVEARRKAIDEAVVSQNQRKKEREEKAAIERAEKEARQLAVDARDAAYRDQEKAARAIERVKKEIAVEQDAIAKIAEGRKTSVAEQTFLRDFVKRAEASARNLENVLTQFAAAESARAAAAATAAAEAARKNS